MSSCTTTCEVVQTTQNRTLDRNMHIHKMPSKTQGCVCVRAFVCVHEVKGYPGWALSFLNVLDNEQMLQKLGKKHRLLPAGLLWPGELAHWRTRGLSSPELPVLLLGNIKGLGTVLLRRACQPLPLSPSLCLSRLWRRRVTVWDARGVFEAPWLSQTSMELFFFFFPRWNYFDRGLKQKQTFPQWAGWNPTADSIQEINIFSEGDREGGCKEL